MTMNKALDKTTIVEKLAALNTQASSGWIYMNDYLEKEFVFDDFKKAFAFMASVARLADHLDHHPDWCNSFNRVKIRLTTHEVNAVSELDFILAQQIEKFV